MKRQLVRSTALLAALVLLCSLSGRAAAPTSAALPEVAAAPMVFDGPLPASPAVDAEWFTGAVFLGGVRVQGLRDSGLLPAAGFLAPDGLNVRAARSEAVFFSRNGQRLTLAQALEGTGYKNVYIMLGVNEASWMEEDSFYAECAGLIDDLRALLPEAGIYVLPPIPVTVTRAAAQAPGNDRLARCGELLRRLAREKRVYLVDTAEVLTTAGGALDGAYSENDGLRLNERGNALLAEYLRTHTAGD